LSMTGSSAGRFRAILATRRDGRIARTFRKTTDMSERRRSGWRASVTSTAAWYEQPYTQLAMPNRLLAEADQESSRRKIPAGVVLGDRRHTDSTLLVLRTGESITVVLLTLRVSPSRRHLTRSVRSTFRNATLIDSPVLRGTVPEGGVTNRRRRPRSGWVSG